MANYKIILLPDGLYLIDAPDIKEGVKFKDQSQANQLLIANENEVLKQGKLYDIPALTINTTNEKDRL